MRTNQHNLPQDKPLRVICSCGHSTRYKSVSEFKQNGGDVTYHQKTDFYAALCPSCEAPRPVKVGEFEWDDIGTEFCLALGRFEDGYNPLDDSLDQPYDPTQTDFGTVANPVYIARQRFDPTCTCCGTRLTKDDKYADGDAPQIGWEYYQCPKCNEQIHPDAVDPLESDSDQESET